MRHTDRVAIITGGGNGIGKATCEYMAELDCTVIVADIDGDAAEDFITFSPAVNFTVSPTSEGFRIFGDFKRGSYTLTLNTGLYSRNGGILKETYTKSLTIPARISPKPLKLCE